METRSAALSIGERRLYDRILRSNERLFRCMFTSAAIPIVITDLDGKIMEGNSHAAELLGYSLAELQSSRESALTFGADREREGGLRQELLAGRRDHYGLEKRLVRKDGKLVHVRSTSYSVRDGPARPTMIVDLWTDITRSKQDERRVGQQAALLDLVDAAVVLCDNGDRIQVWSQGAERLYGWSSAEMIGEGMARLLFGAPPGTLAGIRKTLVASGAWSGTMNQTSRAAAALVVEGRWRILRDDAGGVASTLIVNVDVTEQRQLEASVLSARRLESLAVLASGLGHDFRSALSPVREAVGVLRSISTDARLLEQVAIVESGVERGEAVVEQLMTFAHGRDGRHESLDIAELIEQVGLSARESLTQSVEVRCEIAPDLCEVFGDSLQMKQALLALCFNARDAMPRGGLLSISATNVELDELYCTMHPDARAGRYVVFAVADNGSGMSPRVSERIFEPFFTTKGVGRGAGMGLSVVLGIVRHHGGFITVKSEGGRGALLSIFLPATSSTWPEVALAPMQGHGELVLAVDNELELLELYRMVLVANGYRVITAQNGIEAVAIFAREGNQIAAVLMDVEMPEMDGVEAIRILRQLNPQARVLVASAAVSAAARVAEQGITSAPVLQKPFTRTSLLSALARLLRPT